MVQTGLAATNFGWITMSCSYKTKPLTLRGCKYKGFPEMEAYSQAMKAYLKSILKGCQYSRNLQRIPIKFAGR